MKVPSLSKAMARLCAALALIPVISGVAQANLCFPQPTVVPGLGGPPNWVLAGQVRTDLNEPRWGPAPLTSFASDLTYEEGFFRLMTDTTGTKLYVSFQTSADHAVPGTADEVYFGISRNNGALNDIAQAVRVKVAPGSPAGSFIAATNFETYSYDVAGSPSQWTVAPTTPAWLVPSTPAVWSNAPGDGVDWGINFVVDLTQLGINTTDTFKLVMAMTIRDENAISDSTIATLVPTPAGQPFKNTLLASVPSSWAPADATGSGCAGGVTIDMNHIGTRNPNPGIINATPGAVNTFFAEPNYAAVPIFAGQLKAEFRIANWGSVADPNAGWIAIPGANAVSSQASGLIEYACPANTPGNVCGMPTPSQTHQCIQVRLNRGPGATPDNTPITTASVYRNMDFVPLSKNTRTAEISVKGLQALLGNSNPRDVYLYVYERNLPAHGKEKMRQPTEVMQATRREFFAAHAPGKPVKDARAALTAIREQRQLTAIKKPVKATKPGVKPQPEPVFSAEDLEKGKKLKSLVTVKQKLQQAWAHYEVRPYYDSGKFSDDGGKKYRGLVAMYPFTLYYEHSGDFYGYSSRLSADAGATLTEIRKPSSSSPGLYKLTIPNEGVGRITTEVEAHDTPPIIKNPPPAEERVKDAPPAGTQVEHKSTCNCSVPGLVGSSLPLFWGAAGLGLVAIARRRRREK